MSVVLSAEQKKGGETELVRLQTQVLPLKAESSPQDHVKGEGEEQPTELFSGLFTIHMAHAFPSQ